MDETSALFGEQAAADFRAAKSIPLHDLSGPALGLSMLHAQQCIEKQLKAIVLRLNEALEIDGSNRFLRRLSHDFYPRLREIRGSFVKNLGMPPASVLRLMGLDDTGQGFVSNAHAIGHVASFWKEYAAPGSVTQMSVWKRSLHVRMSRDELDALNTFVRKSATILPDMPESDGSWSRPAKTLTNDFGRVPPMRSVIRDAGRTGAGYSDCVWAPPRRGMQELHDEDLGRQDRLFSNLSLRRLGGLARSAQAQAVKRLVAEFAFGASAIAIYRYMTLYPHCRLGRYPERLPGGMTTTDIYESRADVVLHRIYNEARFSLGLLRDHDSKLGELCRLGHEHGYWQDGAGEHAAAPRRNWRALWIPGSAHAASPARRPPARGSARAPWTSSGGRCAWTRATAARRRP